MFKGVGGGSRSILGSQLFLKIEVLYFKELFTEWKNLQILQFCDVAKLVWFRKYIGNPILKKIMKILIWLIRKTEYLESTGALGKLKTFSGGDLIIVSRLRAAIFEIFIFWPESGPQICKNSQKRPKMD